MIALWWTLGSTSYCTKDPTDLVWLTLLPVPVALGNDTWEDLLWLLALFEIPSWGFPPMLDALTLLWLLSWYVPDPRLVPLVLLRLLPSLARCWPLLEPLPELRRLIGALIMCCLEWARTFFFGALTLDDLDVLRLRFLGDCDLSIIVSNPRRWLVSWRLLAPLLELPSPFLWLWSFELLLVEFEDTVSAVLVLVEFENDVLLVALLPLSRFLLILELGAGSLGGLLPPFSLLSIYRSIYYTMSLCCAVLCCALWVCIKVQYVDYDTRTMNTRMVCSKVQSKYRCLVFRKDFSWHIMIENGIKIKTLVLPPRMNTRLRWNG